MRVQVVNNHRLQALLLKRRFRKDNTGMQQKPKDGELSLSDGAPRSTLVLSEWMCKN